MAKTLAGERRDVVIIISAGYVKPVYLHHLALSPFYPLSQQLGNNQLKNELSIVFVQVIFKCQNKVDTTYRCAALKEDMSFKCVKY